MALFIAGLALCATGCSANSGDKEEGPPPPHMSSAPLSYADVVQRVAPAVVTVRSAKRVRVSTQPFGGDDFLRRFFGGRFLGPGSPSEVERSLGSGVIVKSDGYILTNNHVIDGAQDIKVDLSNHRTYSAKVVGADPPSDLAVLKIDADNLRQLQLGDSDQVRVGDICLAIGNPLGIGETVTSGIISAKGRRTGLSNGSFEDFLQTDASINQGNSGGALINTNGALIGINSQILSPNGGNIGIGFAIPSNMAKTVMDQLIRSGKVSRGHLGVTVQPMTSDLAQTFGLSNVQGVLVNSVEQGSPADKAGVKSGDVIVALNGKKIDDPNSFRNEVASTGAGNAITLTLFRNRMQMEVKATLAETPASGQPQARSNARPTATGQLGISVEPLTPDVASELGAKSGTTGVVITDIDPDGAAANAGLQTGDIIAQINHQPIRSVNDVGPALDKAGSNPSLLLVNRGGQAFFVTVNRKP